MVGGCCENHLLARITSFRVTLREINRRKTEQGQIQQVKPNNRTLRLVAMIMPMPCRCYYDIASFQGHFLPFNGREALSVHDEATCKGYMTMGRGCLSWVHNLQACIDCIGSVWCSCQSVVLAGHYPSPVYGHTYSCLD